MGPFLAIARVTGTEVSRKPAYAIVVVGTLLGYNFSPQLAMFTLRDDAALLQDFGVSMVFLSGLLLVGLGAASLAAGENERAALRTVLSKPVRREVVFLGQVAGVLVAAAAAGLLFALALLLAARQGPPARVGAPVDWPVQVALWGGLAATLAAGAWRGVRRGRSLAGELLPCGLLIYPVLAALASLFDRGWGLQPPGRGFDALLVQAVILASLGVAVVGVFAVVAAAWTRRGVLLATVAFFALGMALGGPRPVWLTVLPDLRVFWVGEVFYGEATTLPAAYLCRAGAYALLESAVWLALGLLSIRARDVR